MFSGVPDETREEPTSQIEWRDWNWK